MKSKAPQSWVSFFVVLSLLLAFMATGNASARPPSSQSTLPTAGLLKTTANVGPLMIKGHVDLSRLSSKTKTNHKLDTSVNKMVQTFRAHPDGRSMEKAATGLGMEYRDGKILVAVKVKPDTVQTVTQNIAAMGGSVKGSHGNTIEAYLPPRAITLLSRNPNVWNIRHPAIFVPASHLQAGTVTSEGVGASAADTWHAEGIDGTGVKLGIIDGDFQGYTDLLGTDLPETVVARDYTGDGMEGGVAHGTAVSEIAYDMAPGAEMYLSKIGSLTDFSNAIDDFIADGVNIASMSLVWLYAGEPGDGTGPVSAIADRARQNGIFFSAAAGNYARSHWDGYYTDTFEDDFHEWIPGVQEVNFFGPGDGSAYLIPAGWELLIYLRWDDWTNVDQDYDLYLLHWTEEGWEIVAISENWQDGGAGETPEEAIDYIVPEDGFYGIAIYRFDATRDVFLDLYEMTTVGLDQRVPERSMLAPANSPSVIAAGASDASDPSYPLEPYSSHGPSNGPGGTPNGGHLRPDITGYDFVSTVSYGPQGFPGTSAAAPHVAGAAALVKQKYPSFTVSQIQNFLESHAIDMGIPGKDNNSGAGRLWLNAPLKWSGIGGWVYHDANFDKMANAPWGHNGNTDIGVYGATVELVGEGIHRTFTTGTSGWYNFGALPPGSYTVNLLSTPDQWTSVTPTTCSLDLAAADTQVECDFGLWWGNDLPSASSAAATSTTVSLPAIQDAYITSWDTSLNAGHERWLKVRQPKKMASLLRFDLSSIPSGANITKAELKLHSSASSNTQRLYMSAYGMEKEWSEDAVTWLQTGTGTPWDIPGAAGTGDHGPAVGWDWIDTMKTENTLYASFDITELASAWLADPSSNHGVLINGEGIGKVGWWFFSTDDPAGLPFAPYLEVTYTTP